MSGSGTGPTFGPPRRCSPSDEIGLVAVCLALVRDLATIGFDAHFVGNTFDGLSWAGGRGLNVYYDPTIDGPSPNVHVAWEVPATVASSLLESSEGTIERAAVLGEATLEMLSGAASSLRSVGWQVQLLREDSGARLAVANRPGNLPPGC